MEIKQELINNAIHGDEVAQNQIFAQLRPFLQRYFESRLGQREEIGDLIQNTLLRVHKSWTAIHQPDRFMGFVMKGALFELHDLYRGRYSTKEIRFDAEVHPEPIHHDSDAADTLDIETVLNLLSDKARQIIELKSAGYPYEEIGQIVGISESAVKMQVKRAFDKIRTFLQEGTLTLIWWVIYG